MWVLKTYGMGGAERLVLELKPHMPDVEVLPVAVAAEPTDLVPAFEARGLDPRTLGARTALDVRWVLALRKLIKQEQPDLVHLHLPLVGVGGRFASLGTATPVVYTEHSLWDAYRPITRWANAATLGMNDVTIAVSQQVERSIRYPLLGRGRRRPRVTVIRNGIDVVRIQEDARPVRQRIVPSGSFGMIGSLERVKGPDLLLQAAVLLARRFPDRRCVFVGDGSMGSELRQRANVLAPRNIDFLGRRDDERRVMAQLDVVVAPSRIEGLPLALLEAMALGRPVVATRVGGIPDLIENEVTGLLVPSDDPAAIANAVGRLFTEAELAGRLGRAARESILESWDARRSARLHADLYTSLLHRAPSDWEAAQKNTLRGR